MFKNKLKILSIVLVLMLLFNCCCFAANETEQAVEEQTGEQLVVEENTTEENIPQEENAEEEKWNYGDLYLSGENITVDKVVDGNVFVCADEVVVSGEVGGDLFVCAKKVTIEGGYVYSNLFVVTQDLTINGIVYDLYGVANNIVLDQNGLVARDFRATSDNVTINGQINRNAFISAKDITMGEKASITGNFKYSAKQEVNIPEGAVTGEVKYEANKGIDFSTNSILQYAYSLLGSLLYTLVVAIIVIKLMPNFIDKINEALKKPQTYLTGLLAIIVVPMVIIILAISSVGLRISFVLTLIYMLLIALTIPTANIWLGKLIKDKFIKNEKVSLMVAILIATLATWILKQIPFIGFIVYMAIVIGGIGLIISKITKCVKKEE